MHPIVKPHTVPNKMRWKKTEHQEKMKAHRELKPGPHALKECKLLCNHPFSSMILWQNYLYVYVRMYNLIL